MLRAEHLRTVRLWASRRSVLPMCHSHSIRRLAIATIDGVVGRRHHRGCRGGRAHSAAVRRRRRRDDSTLADATASVFAVTAVTAVVADVAAMAAVVAAVVAADVAAVAADVAADVASVLAQRLLLAQP